MRNDRVRSEDRIERPANRPNLVFDNTLILFLSDNGGCDEVIQGRDTRQGFFQHGGTSPAVLPGDSDTYAAYGVN